MTFCGTVLIAISLQCVPSPNPASQYRNQKPAAYSVKNKTAEVEYASYPSLLTEIELQSPTKNADNSTDSGNDAEQRLVTATWALFYATVGLGIIAIFGSWIAYCTLKDIRSQTHNAKIAAIAARDNSQAVLNSERAWIMAELDWVPGMSWLYDVNTVEAHQRNSYISGSFRLTCRNEGKTPGWITLVCSRLQVVSTLPDPPQFDNWRYVDPIERAFSPNADPPHHWDMGLDAPTASENDTELRIRIVWGVVEYRDIFDKTRRTIFGYSVGLDNKTLTRLTSRAYNRNE